MGIQDVDLRTIADVHERNISLYERETLEIYSTESDSSRASFLCLSSPSRTYRLSMLDPGCVYRAQLMPLYVPISSAPRRR